MQRPAPANAVQHSRPPTAAATVPRPRAKSSDLIEATRVFRDAVSRLKFSPPVACVYNPLDYAWPAHELYLARFGNGRKRVVFLGMNPGPFGMTQTGVPFGEIAAVRDWMQIHASIGKPRIEHHKRPISGFACTRSEVSGRRLWNYFAARFGSAESFFHDHFVLNYCPLAFLEESGRNLTPDKLAAREKLELFEACDRHLRTAMQFFQPEWIIGIGDFAAKRAAHVFAGGNLKIGSVLHPSPASPRANKDWAGAAELQLRQLGVWA